MAAVAGPVPKPTAETLRGIADSFGFKMEPKDEAAYLKLLQDDSAIIDYVAGLTEYRDSRLDPGTEERKYAQPPASENPLNAWSHRTEIKPTGTGPLSGKTVAVKDNICVAGLPLTGGTQPYHLSKDKPYPISDIDAPVIARVLEAGGTIAGTSTCENYCMSAMSFTSATGPVDNPWLKGYECGGSSSGSGALVGIKCIRKWKEKKGEKVEDDGLGEGADFALGGDQGGSIRLPSAYSGIYGLKPTHGLVPYTGIAALHPMIDHCGPMAGSVRDVALLLSVIAGYDGIDPRMTPQTPLRSQVPAYADLLDSAIAARTSAGDWTPTTAARGMRIGLIKEAWEVPNLSAEVASAVSRAGERFRELGGTVDVINIPLHRDGAAIWTAATHAHMADTFLANEAPTLLSHPLPGLAPPSPDQKWYDTMTAANPAVVSVLLHGAHLRSPGRFPAAARAKAVMHVHQLRAAYDAALEKYDVLITPVNPTVGWRHPAGGEGVLEKLEMALGNTKNTMPFNATGHPGLVIPVGWGKVEDGEGRLPVGMQMIGKRFGEEKLLLAAAAWEVGGLGWDN
ncbi:Amidase [Pleurostoma richardsiae]|uniref:Amidase n=1 Tax=Pleurostoma richardsiae TaxID=41990 RepID=A0AA38S0L5_9PEZI|nr:Amidase [Pleurostoma richardsiae]